MIEQDFRGLDGACAGDGHQGRLSFGRNSIRISSGFQQPFDHRRIRILAGQIQRSDAVPICRLGIGSSSKELIYFRQVIRANRQVQRSSPIGLGCVAVGGETRKGKKK